MLCRFYCCWLLIAATSEAFCENISEACFQMSLEFNLVLN